MNKKYIVKAPNEETVFCVLSPDQPAKEQLASVLQVHGGGLSVELTDKEILVMDYFHGSPMTIFTILSLEDTDLPVSLSWSKAEGQ